MPFTVMRVLRRPLLQTLALGLLWTLAVSGAFLAEAYWFWHPSIARGETQAIENHLVGLLNQAVAEQRLGSAALVLIERGEIVAEHGFGIAQVETTAPVRPDQTLYQVASVSKAVTAWGVMKLVQEGTLGLDEPVLLHLRRWRFPGSGPYRDRVTVRHLLSHTAGLDDGLGYGGFLPGQALQTLEASLSDAKDSTVGRPRAVTVAREPGTAFAYSGGGYTVLQLLIEEVTKQPFADYMRAAVLRPLNMRTASFDLDQIVADGNLLDLATPFDREVNASPRRRHTAKAAVSLYATPRDLAQFLRATLMENPVLRQETVQEMLRPQPGTSTSWGLGYTLFATTDEGGRIVGHDGGTPPGWGAMLRFNPATGNGMVLTASGGAGAVNQLGHDWIYWETGQVTPAARRQRLYDRLVPVSVAILLGLVVIALWSKRRLPPA